MAQKRRIIMTGEIHPDIFQKMVQRGTPRKRSNAQRVENYRRFTLPQRHK